MFRHSSWGMASAAGMETSADVTGFINAFADSEQKRKDSFELVKLMQDFTGCEPKMWSPSKIQNGERVHLRQEIGRYRSGCAEGNNGGGPLSI